MPLRPDAQTGGLFVEDDGDGLPGTDAEIAALFSVARPLSSSKLLRLPTRGALGNGLRVVAGAVLASGGTLTVKTRGRALRLRPRDADGMTDVEHVRPWKGKGTRIEVLLGEALPVDVPRSGGRTRPPQWQRSTARATAAPHPRGGMTRIASMS